MGTGTALLPAFEGTRGEDEEAEEEDEEEGRVLRRGERWPIEEAEDEPAPASAADALRICCCRAGETG